MPGLASVGAAKSAGQNVAKRAGSQLPKNSISPARPLANQPQRGVLSQFDKVNLDPSQEELQDHEDRRKNSLVGASASNMARATLSTAKRFGSDQAFKWLLGGLIPSFGLTLIGLNALWPIANRAGAPLASWQKAVVVGLDLLLAIIMLILIVIIIVSYCNSPLMLAKGLLSSDFCTPLRLWNIAM